MFHLVIETVYLINKVLAKMFATVYDSVIQGAILARPQRRRNVIASTLKVERQCAGAQRWR